MATWHEVSAGLGRNELPVCLFEFWEQNEWDREDLADAILDAWQLAEFPTNCLAEAHWVEMFEDARGSFPLTDWPEEVPPDPVELYRGAAIDHMRGMSWTWDPERGEWFAKRSVLFGFEAVVLTVTLPHTMLLGIINSSESRGESEAIVNPGLLCGEFEPEVIRRFPGDGGAGVP